MADSRTKDLAGTVISSELQALLDTLYFNVDDTSFSDAKKMLLKTIFTEAIVTANTINYQAMTPKAFYDSIMTTTRKGIGVLATNAEVTAKTGVGLLNSVHQTLMQTQWFTDWFVGSGVPTIYQVDNVATPKVMSFDVNIAQNMTAGVLYVINPPKGSEGFANIQYNCVATLSSLRYDIKETFGFISGAAAVEHVIDSSDLIIGLSANGGSIYLKYGYISTIEVRFSGHFNAIML